MYAVDDEVFLRARSLVTALARELTAQEQSGSKVGVDLSELVRRSADAIPDGGEASYVSGLATDLAKLFSVEAMFPRKRRAHRS